MEPASDEEKHEAESGSAPRAVDWENPRVAAILAAAAKCFARKGFTATTLAEIGKELGLRKSIVHYYFASKAALIHEVQSFTYHKYLDRVRESLRASGGDTPGSRAQSAMTSLWEALLSNKASTGLNIEVWSASRRDPELKRRAAALQRDARKLVAEGVADVMGLKAEDFPPLDAISCLVLAVFNGLAVADYLEGDEAKVQEAFAQFLYLMRLGIKSNSTARSGSSASPSA
ncbi:MAG TPA: TetR/AcrR family transcriptional regulator [Polyangiaceae bacterium]